MLLAPSHLEDLEFVVLTIMDAIRKTTGGIYIHIPFCEKKCSYCDFYSITDLSLISQYLRALIAEIEQFHPNSLKFDSIYIGGGTPSILRSDDIGRILEVVFKRFDMLADSEITIEVNPGTVSLAQFNDYRRFGVNRLNIGIQSFQSDNLAFLERIHSAEQAKLAVEWALQAEFENIGVDLIYGLPEQRKDVWRSDLKQAIQNRPDHISCYMLTCEPGTPLHHNLKFGLYRPLPDSKINELFYLTIEYLESHGYCHYEISNFARQVSENKRSKISRHNSKYWSFAPYIGIGASAHSFIEPQRYWNTADVAKYIQNIEAGNTPVEASETLTINQLAMEAILLGLRTRSGMDIKAFDHKFETDFKKMFGETISELEKDGMIHMKQNRLVLSRKGMAFLDSIVSMFTDHL
jgi:oxygen-independent coproporphyrinogen-3 oxidase